MRILLTGFEPFNNNDFNPSYEAIKNINIEGHIIKSIEVPVIYEEGYKVVLENIKSFNPNLVISFGLAEGRKYITPELLAINYMYAHINDNSGTLKNGNLINDDSDKAYFTSIDIVNIIDYLNKENDIYRISFSAGAYVCNNLYYHILKDETLFNYKGLFIHVPSTKDMNIDDIKKGIVDFLKEIIK